MTDLKNEIDKLIDYLHFESRDTLENADIDFICIKSMEAQIFDISNGALCGDFVKAAKALNILRATHDKKVNPVAIAATISSAINDLCRVDNCINQGMPIATIAKELSILDFVVKKHAAILSSRNKDFNGKDSFCTTISKISLEYGKKLKSSRTDGYELLLELIFKLSLTVEL
jgi:DNA polymerase III delta subunit